MIRVRGLLLVSVDCADVAVDGQRIRARRDVRRRAPARRPRHRHGLARIGWRRRQVPDVYLDALIRVGVRVDEGVAALREGEVLGAGRRLCAERHEKQHGGGRDHGLRDPTS